MELLSQWECTKITLIYVAKLPLTEVLPASKTLPVLDNSLNQVVFWPFPPKDNFRNHEVGSRGSTNRLQHPQRDHLLWLSPGIWAFRMFSAWNPPYGGRGFWDKWLWVVSKLWSSWERCDWHCQVGLRMPSWQQRALWRDGTKHTFLETFQIGT